MFTEQNEDLNVALNHINVQAVQLIEDLSIAGYTSNPRGLKTKEANLATLEIDPYYSIMNFKDRQMNWKYFAGEVAWYIKANNDIDYISNFSSFWKNICNEDNTANSNYGNLLFNRHPSMNMNNNNVNQLEWVFNSLVKDKNTRQAVAFFNSPYYQYPGNKDFVCTMYLNFWIRNDKLDMKVQMRSNDIFFGLTFDAPWFSTIMQSMYLNLKKIYPNLKLGTYYHCADNIHYYERHFDLVEKILENNLDSSIRLELKNPLFIFTPCSDIHYELVINPLAISYANLVDDVLESGIKTDNEYWRTTLELLYNIH